LPPSEIDRVESDRVILDCAADFDREDQGEMGSRMLERSFENTYRR